MSLSLIRRFGLGLLLGSLILFLSSCQLMSGNSSGGNNGVFTLNPAQVSFGSVKVGNNQKTNVTISNTGTADFTIDHATLSGAGFTMGNMALPMTLHAGNSTSAALTFAPASSGSFTGSITFTTTGAQSSVSLPLSGTGTASGTLVASPTSVSFGSVTIGKNASQSVTITNSGSTSVTISQATVTGAGLSVSGTNFPVTLSNNQSVTLKITFAPAAAGAVSGNLAITSDANSLSIALSGTGVTPGSMSANPSTISFGSVQVGSTSTKSETVTNTGGTTVTLSQANVSGAGYSVTGLTLPTTLAASQSVTFTVKFAPTAAGTVNGSVSLVSDASNSPLNIALSGTATTPGQLAVSPTTLNFGNVTVGAKGTLNGTLTASSASVTISSASTNSSEFTLSGITLPTTLAAGQSTGFTVSFAPQATGTATATLPFSSNATNAPTTQSLTGTGTAPTHSVALTWSSSSGAVGYNVYRGGVSGGPYSRINGTLDASTGYTDTTVAAGTTYYYVVTAVDSSANESGYSNQATAVVPSP